MISTNHAPGLALRSALGALVFWTAGLFAIAFAGCGLVGVWWAFGLAFTGEPITGALVLLGAWVFVALSVASLVAARLVNDHRPRVDRPRTSSGRVEM